MAPIELQVSQTPGDVSRGLTFFVAVVLVVGGLVTAVVEANPRPLVATMLGIALYVYLGGLPILLPVFAEVDCVAVYGSMQKRLHQREASAGSP